MTGGECMSSKTKASTLLKRYKENPQQLTSNQKDKLIMEYAPLIKFIAYKISMRLPSNIELDDLIASGAIGLMDAIEKYDPSRDNTFKTYAEFRIRGAILDELRNQDWVPRSIRDKAKLLEKTFSQLKNDLGRDATDQEAADKLGLSMDEFHDLVYQVCPVSILSFDNQTTFSSIDKKSMLGFLEDFKIDNPFNELQIKVVKDIIMDSINSLPEKHKIILSLYYYEDLNLKEIGRVLRITESRVSQLHAQAIVRLKAKLSSSIEEETRRQVHRRRSCKTNHFISASLLRSYSRR